MRAFRDACVVLATVLCAVEGFSPAAVAACAEGSGSSWMCDAQTSTLKGLECRWVDASSCVPQAERRCREWSEDESLCSFYSEIETGRECMWDASSATCVLSPPPAGPTTPAPETRTPVHIDLNEAADKLATGAVVGIVIGSVAVIIICALCVFCLVRTSSNAKAPPQQEMQTTTTTQDQKPTEPTETA